jgi:hypothetical protein
MKRRRVIASSRNMAHGISPTRIDMESASTASETEAIIRPSLLTIVQFLLVRNLPTLPSTKRIDSFQLECPICFKVISVKSQLSLKYAYPGYM